MQRILSHLVGRRRAMIVALAAVQVSLFWTRLAARHPSLFRSDA